MPTLERLRLLIQEAFPRFVDLSHADCVELRAELRTLHDEDLLALLGPVMLDLAETPTTVRSEPDWADMVVRFLCSAAPPPTEATCVGAADFRQFVQEYNEFARLDAPKMDRLFRKFTRAQASAICEWLRLVRSRPAWRIPEDELAAAHRYWEARAQQGASEGGASDEPPD